VTAPVAAARAWLRALRLHFYSATVVLYAVGAFAAVPWQRFDGAAFAVGLLAILALEAATVFVNELIDWPTDARNRLFGPFNGGSRVLVEYRLTPAALTRGALIALAIATASIAALVAVTGSVVPLVPFALLGVAALGYTLPPLALCYRTLGELDVALTHGLGLVLCGFVFQSGALLDPRPWLLAVPIGIAMVPAITLAGIPDRRADRTVGKRTIAVRFGSGAACAVAVMAAWLAALAALVFARHAAVADALAWLPYVALPHAALLTLAVGRHVSQGTPERRIDGLIVLALTY
jgi:1,4-dihydroxy-2-naphthoate polyprenyltransferase